MNKCINCKKRISKKAKRCKSCAKKGNKISFIDGRSTTKHYCLDCDKEIWYTSIRCRKCAKQGELHSQFGTKRPDVSDRMRGKGNPIFIDGRTSKKYYCSECDTEIWYNKDSKGKCQICYDRMGDKNPNWQGGLTEEVYPIEFKRIYS